MTRRRVLLEAGRRPLSLLGKRCGIARLAAGFFTAPMVFGLALSGCGGGSPSDIVLPGDVDVTLAPLGLPPAHGLGLELAGKDGRDVELRVTGIGLEGATGVAFQLQFDSGLLELTGSAPGTFFGSGAITGAAVVQNDGGHLVGVAAAADQATGLSGSGPILILRFRLKELRDADADLVFGVPETQVYGPGGPASGPAFTGAHLSSRIRAPQ